MQGKELRANSWYGADGARRVVGGMLVQIAAPILTDFHADLYLDCTWVHGLQLPNPGESLGFFYVVRDWGTHVVTTGEPRQYEQMGTWRQTWRVEVGNVDQELFAIVATLVNQPSLEPVS